MIKAFLSHSSKDKDGYIRHVANWLGKDNIVYDEFTFEEGEKSIDEIFRGLEKTSVFVFFISNHSLNSDWVKKEIHQAKSLLDSQELKKILPIVIDDSVSYQDIRIPDWLRDYNLRPIKRAAVAARRIHSKLRELSWLKHPKLKSRQNLFVGRNEKLEEFEERIHNFEKSKPLAIISSGLPGIGRRTFLNRALFKTNIIDSMYKPSALMLEREVSIEDFILKLNDLGLVDFGIEVHSLAHKTMEEKFSLIHKVMKAAYDAREVIYIVDEGTIVSYKREMNEWFVSAISEYSGESFPVFCIASKYNVSYKSRPRNDKYCFIELNELNPNERKRLFVQLLEIEKIKLNEKDFENVFDLLFGFPDQVMYAVDLICEDKTSHFSDKLVELREYNSDKASVILRKYEKDESMMNFIRLLSQFEVISKDFIFFIVPETDAYPLLDKLASEHIIEMLGVDGDVVRLNDVIRDYIKRNKLKLTDEYNIKIKEHVKEFIASDDIFERDSSEFIFGFKEALKNGFNIDHNLLIPSHYLRCMKDLYHSKGNLDQVVSLADIILQKKNNLEKSILQDIRYYLCLALAKKQDKRMLNEVQNVNGNEHLFLLGFYYRRAGRYKEALENFNKIIDKPYVDSRAKREIVQVYVYLEEFNKALDFAERNYEENRGNQFHIQAYFNCLINSDNPYKNKDKLKYLINELRNINSDQSNEMADISESLFYARLENNKQVAFDKIEDCVYRYPDSHYPLLTFCDIALKYFDKSKLGEGVQRLYKVSANKHLSSRTLNRYKSYLFALEGKEDEALRVISDDIARYPPESKDRIIDKIKYLATESKVNNS